MPVQILNGTPADLANYQQAMNYINSAPGMQSIRNEILSSNLNIVFTNNNRTEYDHSTRTVYWDPSSSMAVIKPDGSLGVQSPALGLLHELYHWFKYTPYAIWDEYTATLFEKDAAIALGEPIRETYYHSSKILSFITVNNPTAKVPGGYWKVVKPDGTEVTGPNYDPNIKVVVIGSDGGSGSGGGSGDGGGPGGNTGGSAGADPGQTNPRDPNVEVIPVGNIVIDDTPSSPEFYTVDEIQIIGIPAFII